MSTSQTNRTNGATRAPLIWLLKALRQYFFSKRWKSMKINGIKTKRRGPETHSEIAMLLFLSLWGKILQNTEGISGDITQRDVFIISVPLKGLWRIIFRVMTSCLHADSIKELLQSFHSFNASPKKLINAPQKRQRPEVRMWLSVILRSSLLINTSR